MPKGQCARKKSFFRPRIHQFRGDRPQVCSDTGFEQTIDDKENKPKPTKIMDPKETEITTPEEFSQTGADEPTEARENKEPTMEECPAQKPICGRTCSEPYYKQICTCETIELSDQTTQTTFDEDDKGCCREYSFKKCTLSNKCSGGNVSTHEVVCLTSTSCSNITTKQCNKQEDKKNACSKCGTCKYEYFSSEMKSNALSSNSCKSASNSDYNTCETTDSEFAIRQQKKRPHNCFKYEQNRNDSCSNSCHNCASKRCNDNTMANSCGTCNNCPGQSKCNTATKDEGTIKICGPECPDQRKNNSKEIKECPKREDCQEQTCQSCGQQNDSCCENNWLSPEALCKLEKMKQDCAERTLQCKSEETTKKGCQCQNACRIQCSNCKHILYVTKTLSVCNNEHKSGNKLPDCQIDKCPCCTLLAQNVNTDELEKLCKDQSCNKNTLRRQESNCKQNEMKNATGKCCQQRSNSGEEKARKRSFEQRNHSNCQLCCCEMSTQQQCNRCQERCKHPVQQEQFWCSCRTCSGLNADQYPTSSINYQQQTKYRTKYPCGGGGCHNVPSRQRSAFEQRCYTSRDCCPPQQPLSKPKACCGARDRNTNSQYSYNNRFSFIRKIINYLSGNEEDYCDEEWLSAGPKLSQVNCNRMGIVEDSESGSECASNDDLDRRYRDRQDGGFSGRMSGGKQSMSEESNFHDWRNDSRQNHRSKDRFRSSPLACYKRLYYSRRNPPESEPFGKYEVHRKYQVNSFMRHDVFKYYETTDITTDCETTSCEFN